MLGDMGDIPRTTLTTAKTALDSIKCPFFLSDGTLLGYVRGGDFVAHDTDIDLGVFADDFSPDIVPAMEKAGLTLQRVIGDIGRGLEFTFVRDGLCLDVFFYYKTIDMFWHVIWKGETRRRYCFTPFALRRVEFRGLSVKVPHPADRTVREQYGPDWKIPILTGWSWWNSPYNLRED
jgi:hypothetical protein